MPIFQPLEILSNQFLLTAERTIFWENERALILSDLHLGKSGHFRKNGIGIPQSMLVEDMQRLVSQIQFYKPEKLIIVGDLFHSETNKEHDLFVKWRNDLGDIPVHLVMGNHDILAATWYKEANITIHKKGFTIGGFSFIHDMKDCIDPGESFYFTGHIHPGITLKGAGRQALRFACFYITKDHAILPAFGRFTGTVNLKPKKGDLVFAVVDKEVIRISQKV